MSAVMVSMAVLIRTFSCEIHTHPVYLNCAYRLRNGIVRGWLYPEFGAELPLDNCTATIVLNIYVDIYIESDSKPNLLNFLFPQNSYNVRIKGIHILNAPPFCDDFICMIKRVFNSKLAAKVSDINRLYFLIVLRVAVSISICFIH